MWEDLLLLQTLIAFARASVREEMGNGPTENPKSRHCYTILDVAGGVKPMLPQKLYLIRYKPL